MKKSPIILTTFLTGYLLMVFLTPISLTGFWTDIIVLVVLLIFTLREVFIKRIENKIIRVITKIITITYSVIFVGLIGLLLIAPFSLNTFQVQVVDVTSNRCTLNFEYFKPTGLTGCGFGTYWKTTTLRYFPVFEYETYKNNCTLDDWGYYIKTGKWE